MRVFSRSLLLLSVAVLGVALLAATASAASAPPSKVHRAHAKAKPKGNLKVRILGKSKKQGTILRNKGIVVKVHSSKRRKVKLSGFSVTYDAGRKQLTKKKVIRFRRAGTRKVKLKLLHGTIKNVRGCTARKIRVRAGRAKSQVQMQRTLGPCRLPSINLGKAKKCDFIADPGNALCMLPFPDNYYTVDRLEQRNRPPDRLQDRRDAGQRLRRTHRRQPLQPPRRLQPGRPDPTRGPRPRQRRRWWRRARADQPHRPLPRRPADRRDRRATGQRRPIWAEIDSTRGPSSRRWRSTRP